MIESVWAFWNINVRRNTKRIFWTTHPYLSGLIALFVVFSNVQLKLSPVASQFVTYNSVVFGFTATAIALAIAIPSPSFVRFLSGIKDGTTPFRDFLFVLAWNGFVHILAFFLLLPIVVLGADWSLDQQSGNAFKSYLFFLFWLQGYACFQFLVTTFSIYELGDLYAQYVAKQKLANPSSDQ